MMHIDFMMLIVYKSNTPISIMGKTFVFPSVGVYAESDNREEFRKLEYYSYVYHKLDKRYLPDDSSALPEVSVDNNGNVLKVVDGAWAVGEVDNPDWNKLENRPFGEEEGELSIVYDGNVEGLISWEDPGNGKIFYKISDLLPTKEELAGGIVLIEANGEQLSRTIDESGNDFTATSDENLLGIIFDSQILFIVAYATLIVDSNTGQHIVPETGIYIQKNSADCITLTWNGIKVRPIDEKFIPDTIARKTDIQTLIDVAIGTAIGGSY